MHLAESWNEALTDGQTDGHSNAYFWTEGITFTQHFLKWRGIKSGNTIFPIISLWWFCLNAQGSVVPINQNNWLISN